MNGVAEGDWFGWSVAMSADGSRVVVGAPLNSANGVNSGSVPSMLRCQYRFTFLVVIQCRTGTGSLRIT
jgi:FG-GAP repeat